MPAIYVYIQAARHTSLATGNFHYNEDTITIYVLFGVYQPGTLNPEPLNLFLDYLKYRPRHSVCKNGCEPLYAA